jgi:hypothetical protein
LLKQFQVFLKHESFKLNPRQYAGERNHKQGGHDQPDQTNGEGGHRKTTAAQKVPHGGGGEDGVQQYLCTPGGEDGVLQYLGTPGRLSGDYLLLAWLG